MAISSYKKIHSKRLLIKHFCMKNQVMEKAEVEEKLEAKALGNRGTEKRGERGDCRQLGICYYREGGCIKGNNIARLVRVKCSAVSEQKLG